jgi:dolichyl-phosphate-mannose--protein O-mannosyl transferase
MATAITSLVLEPLLALHVGLGFVFIFLVGCHLDQRRRISRRLASQLLRIRRILLPKGRTALVDGTLLTLTMAMLFSGFWDLLADHHTKFRWHAITGVVLTIFLVTHTAKRWKRLRVSQIR